jgi:hypothetical protein
MNENDEVLKDDLNEKPIDFQAETYKLLKSIDSTLTFFKWVVFLYISFGLLNFILSLVN